MQHNPRHHTLWVIREFGHIDETPANTYNAGTFGYYDDVDALGLYQTISTHNQNFCKYWIYWVEE